MRTLLAAVVIGGAFGSATATVESIEGDVMVVSIEVEVAGSADSVVAHLAFENDESLVLPLLDRGDGTYGLRTELAPKNYFVVFETIGAEGQRSEPVSLTEMGAELGPESGPTATTISEEGDLDTESAATLWLAVALGAASLSLLAFWVLGGRVEEDEAGDEVEDSADRAQDEEDGADDEVEDSADRAQDEEE